ncbi:MAG TPA: metal ABC transporter permease [Steroidobacter sp.]|nr:metal ABC transporter permease [Steroidobacter sp.]
MNLLATDLSILWPALIAGVLVAISHVPLGQQVLSRGIVFIDLAIAQVAGLGVIAANSFGLPVEGWGPQAAAGAAALAGALLLTWTERKRPEVQEALIGILFVLASTAQILLLANDPHGGENLKELLAGQILWVSNGQLIRTAVLTAIFSIVWFRWREQVGRAGFYVLFAVVVTASVQLVGVYLVFTTLIVPAVATYRHASSRQLVLGYALAFGSYLLGLAASVVTDLPSSPVIVWAMAILGLIVHLTATRSVLAEQKRVAVSCSPGDLAARPRTSAHNGPAGHSPTPGSDSGAVSGK